jgi:hypothetical protein
MQAPAIETTQAQAKVLAAPVRDVPSRLINPITGYALAAVVSAGFWALLLVAIF